VAKKKKSLATWQRILPTAVVTAIITGSFTLAPVLIEERPATSGACAVLVQDVQTAVEAGIDQPALFRAMAVSDCTMDPVVVAEDIRDG
jgi:hypothetical protein